MRVPLLATVPAMTAACSAVMVTSRWPMADCAVAAPSGKSPKVPAEVDTPRS